jgi:hypothetical protein
VNRDTAHLSFTLVNANPLLDRITVTATGASLRMAEFESRWEHAIGGQFLTSAEIGKRNSVFATELMRTFKGLNVKPQANANGISEHFAVSTRTGALDVAPRVGKTSVLYGCPIEVYVDNIRMPTPFNLDDLPPASSLAGIEFYAGPASTPPQFGGVNRRCGVIVVWTKDGSAEPM